MGRTGRPARTGSADCVTRLINVPLQRFTQNKNSYKAGKARNTLHKIILYWKVIPKQKLKFSHLFLIQQGDGSEEVAGVTNGHFLRIIKLFLVFFQKLKQGIALMNGWHPLAKNSGSREFDRNSIAGRPNDVISWLWIEQKTPFLMWLRGSSKNQVAAVGRAFCSQPQIPENKVSQRLRP